MESDELNNEFEKIPRKILMKSPEGYFDQFPRHMQNMVASKPSPRKHSFSPQLAWVIPGVLVLLVGLYFFSPSFEPSQNPQQLLAMVSDDSLLEYLQESGIDWAEYDIEFSESDLDDFYRFDSELMEEELNADLFLDVYFED
jgi:hypothetical protein